MLTLNDIEEAYQVDASFEHLKNSRFVPGNGPFKRGIPDPYRIMMVGEAPGKYENEWAVPFVGPSGRRILEPELNIIGLTRDDVYLTNILKYRPYPPYNRSPNPFEIKSSLPYLTEEVDIVNPKIIVLLGKIATNAFYPELSFGRNRGTVRERKGRKVLITYHPAAIIYDRTGTKVQAMRSDYQKLAEMIEDNA